MAKTTVAAAAAAMTKEQFEALDPAAKRVAIARDALAQLEAGRIIARCGTYFRAEVTRASGELRDLMRRGQLVECEVCELGALFAGAVNLADDFEVDDHVESGELFLSDIPVRRRLALYFDEQQMALIEAAFEGWVPPLSLTAFDVGQYRDEIPVASERMGAIGRNIERNGGVFVPTADDWKKGGGGDVPDSH